jgi:hypothetical protein
MVRFKLLIATLLYVCSLSAQVPDTQTVSLNAVAAEIGSEAKLSVCFANAKASGFDPTYAKSGDWLSEFRNYRHVLYPVLPSYQLTISQTFPETVSDFGIYSTAISIHATGSDNRDYITFFKLPTIPPSATTITLKVKVGSVMNTTGGSATYALYYTDWDTGNPTLSDIQHTGGQEVTFSESSSTVNITIQADYAASNPSLALASPALFPGGSRPTTGFSAVGIPRIEIGSGSLEYVPEIEIIFND